MSVAGHAAAWAIAVCGAASVPPAASAAVLPATPALARVSVAAVLRVDDFTGGETSTLPPPPLASPLALAAAEPDDPVGGGRMAPRKRDGQPKRSGRLHPVLNAARARILLQSLTLPGWGQATLGRRTSATVFAVAETGIWASFTAFRVQQHLRRLSYENTAQLFAGVHLEGRDEEFRRIVGSFPSSEDYNRLVVARDAANIHMQPGREDPVAYRQYISEHELRGNDTWAWDSEVNYERYREERKQVQRASQRANTVLAVAIGNRLLSAIHAARYAGQTPAPARSWNLECVPAGNDPTAFHLGVRVRF